MTFDELRDLRNRRAVLEAERETLMAKMDDALARLVAEYGADWRVRYDDALARISEWGAAGA